MRYTTQATIEGAPKFEVRARAEPIGVSGAVEGAVRAAVGPIDARVGAVPIMLAVPFLGGLTRVGAVGPFDLRLEPVELAVERLELRCDAVLGPEGLTCGLEGAVACNWQVDLTGTLPGRVTRAAVEFGEPDEFEGER